MSGDVQPRKRKDKRRKKDELSLDELRGTSAVFGEGDVLMHSYQDHGTGGHWCAKIIFFSLLAILITLIGLIILENRGLSELEANSVESRYSGVLEGWLEDAPEDDHHDEHTLDLKHHDIKEAVNRAEEDHNDNVISNEEDQTEDEEASDEKKDEEEHSRESGENNINSVEEDIDEDIDQNDNEDEDVPYSFRRYFGAEDDNDENEQDNDDIQQDEGDDIQHEDDDIQQDDDDDDNQKDDEDDDDIQQDDDSLEDDDDDIQQDDDGHEDDDDDDTQEDDEDSDEIVKSGNGENAQEDINDIDNIEDGVDNTEEKYFKNPKYNEDDEDDQREEPKYSHISKEDDDNENSQENSRSEEHELSTDTERLTNDDSNENQFSRIQEDDNQVEENKEDADEHDDDDEENEPDLEVEKIEKEVIEDSVSTELPALPEDDDDDNTFGISRENGVDDEEEIEFLEPGDDDEPSIVEPVTAPAGKPFIEVDEDSSTIRPPGPDSLTEEEEYEKRQEELRREKEQASQMWLKLIVGGALLLATHAVVRRVTVSPDVPKEQDSRKESTASAERYMSLIPEEPSTPVLSEVSDPEPPLQVTNETFKRIPFITKSAPTPKQTSEEDDNYERQDFKEMEESVKEIEDKELYSDDDDEEVEEEEVVEEKKEAENEPADMETEEDMGDEVEIIDHEQLEEVEEESVEEDEEDISDVDDAELLNRLEAKYGRLPEPERPGQKYKDGGQSMDETWPGEPSDAYWRGQLDTAEDEFNQGAWRACARRVEAGGAALRDSARARWLAARALDAEAEALRDNKALTAAINAYMHLLKMGDRLSDKRLLEITERTLDRIQFRGTYLSAEPIYRMLIRRFPDEPTYRNKLVVAFLMANRQDLAEDLLNETLKRWPDDRFALAHLGFVLKTRHNKLEEAVKAFQKALEGDSGPANEPRFYYHLGDALMLLSRNDEAREVHERGAALGHFLSASQRSLYNVPRLKSQPWWDVEKTPYVKLARALEKSWRQILEEGRAAEASYEQEKEGLKERGDWSQMDLFVRGQEVAHRCALAPVTCAIVRAEPEAAGCRRGQVKFSAMRAGTHVRAHVGPTNCRLRMHLGLSNTKHTYIRVDKEIRQWQEGKVLMFDDSFEHEVWHNGTGARLVLIVDVWHPGLTPAERRTLPAI